MKKKRGLNLFLCTALGISMAIPAAQVSTNAMTDMVDTYVAVLRENEGVVVKRMDMTAGQAYRYQMEEEKLLSFDKEAYVTGSKTEKEQKEQEKEQRKQEKELHKQFKKEQHEFNKILKKSADSDMEWNYQMANIEEASETADLSGGKVKVALLDSGVDFTEDIDVYMRKNFIPGQDEISVLYEDLPGHGTSIAGILAAKENEDGITGINPNMELYSARILDEKLNAPVSRVVEAIYWAMENDVNIINISFGTTSDSEVLHQAIKAAYDQGILLVAAAGNKGVLEYPAAYEEVIAVGAVGSNGERSEGSATGNGLELMAPGDQILSTGAFGGVSVSNGTSMAVPHVVGVASLLWEKDLSCSADFIRALLNVSANQYGTQDEYGNGLIDYAYALKLYDEMKEANEVSDAGTVYGKYEDAEIENNTGAVSVFDDVTYVNGSWGTSGHQLITQSASGFVSIGTDQLAIIKLGAVAPDTYVPGMNYYPEWHGFYKKAPGGTNTIYTCNYMASYIYLTNIASGVNAGYWPSDVDDGGIITNASKNNILCAFDGNSGFKVYNQNTQTGTVSWNQALGEYSTSNRNKSLFIYGMALHTATDMFAHSTAIGNNRITHPNADDYNYVRNRYVCAKLMAVQLLQHALYGNGGTILDYYYVANSPNETSHYQDNDVYCYDSSAFKVINFAAYAQEIASYYYSTHSSVFDAMSCTIQN